MRSLLSLCLLWSLSLQAQETTQPDLISDRGTPELRQAVCNLEAAEGTSIMWWNIQYGATGRALSRDLIPTSQADLECTSIVIGDFNSTTPMDGLLSSVTSELSLIENPRATFPANSSAWSSLKPDVTIDHAMIVDGAREPSGAQRTTVVSEQLDLQGSDHYPLYIIIE